MPTADIRTNPRIQATGPGVLSLRRAGAWVPVGGYRTPVLVQQAVSESAATTTRTPTLAATPSPASLLIALVLARSGNAAADVGMSAGWNQVAMWSAAGGNARVGIWTKVAGLNESKSYTVTAAVSTGIYATIVEYAGVTDVVDVSSMSDSAGSTAISRTLGPTADTAFDTEFALAYLGANSTIGTASWSNGFTQQNFGTSHTWATKTLTSRGPVTTTATWQTARINTGILLTFKVKGTPRRPRGIYTDAYTNTYRGNF